MTVATGAGTMTGTTATGTTGIPTTENRNAGNAVTADLKWHLKLARQQSIHVSPTVLVDGLVDGQVSSAWSMDQWIDHLKECKIID